MEAMLLGKVFPDSIKASPSTCSPGVILPDGKESTTRLPRLQQSTDHAQSHLSRADLDDSVRSDVTTLDAMEAEGVPPTFFAGLQPDEVLSLWLRKCSWLGLTSEDPRRPRRSSFSTCALLARPRFLLRPVAVSSIVFAGRRS